MTAKKQSTTVAWVDPDDAPELTAEMREQAEVFDGTMFLRRGRGRPKSASAKEQISVRLDPDVLMKLRAAGPGWQAQINPMLREALGLADAGSKKARAA